MNAASDRNLGANESLAALHESFTQTTTIGNLGGHAPACTETGGSYNGVDGPPSLDVDEGVGFVASAHCAHQYSRYHQHQPNSADAATCYLQDVAVGNSTIYMQDVATGSDTSYLHDAAVGNDFSFIQQLAMDSNTGCMQDAAVGSDTTYMQDAAVGNDLGYLQHVAVGSDFGYMQDAAVGDDFGYV